MSAPRLLFLAEGGTRRHGSADLPYAGATDFSWRLVAGNNRLLGCSPGSYPDLERCQRSLSRLLAEIDDAVARPAPGSGPGRWAWQLCLLGPGREREVLATSARTYERQRESRYNLDGFLEAVPLAVVSSSVAVRFRGGARQRDVSLPLTVLPSPVPSQVLAGTALDASQPRPEDRPGLAHHSLQSEGQGNAGRAHRQATALRPEHEMPHHRADHAVS